jgi:hypothetical protein
MIPAILIEKFGPVLAKVIFWGAALALLVVVLGVAKCSYDQRAKAEIKLATGQHGAAIASGSDAVGTLGNRMQADAAGQITVQETKDAINNASDAGGVTDAGLAGLCHLRGYSRKPECVRAAAPR